jgi:hypothetical protein
LTPEEEIYCEKVIIKLQKTMKERRVLLDPFFKDYDKVILALIRPLVIWAESLDHISVDCYTLPV